MAADALAAWTASKEQEAAVMTLLVEGIVAADAIGGVALTSEPKAQADIKAGVDRRTKVSGNICNPKEVVRSDSVWKHYTRSFSWPQLLTTCRRFLATF